MMMMVLKMTTMMMEKIKKNGDYDYNNVKDDDDNVDVDHVAVGAPWVHPVCVHELDRSLAHWLHWTIDLVDVMIMKNIMMMKMMMMMMMMMMMTVIITSCTA